MAKSGVGFVQQNASILMIFEFFNCFPCTIKRESSEYGIKIVVKPKSRFAYYAKSGAWLLIIYASLALNIWNMSRYFNPDQNMMTYLDMFLSSSRTTTEKLGFLAPLTLTSFVMFALNWNGYSLSSRLAAFEAHLEEVIIFPNIHARKYSISSILVAFGFTWVAIGMSVGSFHYFGSLNVFPQIPLSYFILSGACFYIMILYSAFHIFGFLTIFNSEINSLLAWCDGLTELVMEKKFCPLSAHVEDFANALHAINEMFAPQLFIMCLGFTTTSICSLFRSFTFLMGGNHVSNDQAIFISSFILFGLIQIYILYNLIIKSHLVVDAIALLLKAIDKLECQDISEKILGKLRNFEGLSAMDYFVLNKPLLTSISANFVTYLIVLIQFRASEKAQ